MDAPELVDDYYLNLLDWSSKNVLAVALGTAVYLWDAESGAISQLMQTMEDDDYVTSIAWAADGKHIAVGINSTEVQIWDACKGSQVLSRSFLILLFETMYSCNIHHLHNYLLRHFYRCDGWQVIQPGLGALPGMDLPCHLEVGTVKLSTMMVCFQNILGYHACLF